MGGLPDLRVAYSPWCDEIRERLGALLPIDVIVQIVQGGGIIAGGSVVYALVSSVPEASVDDIDIFFLGAGALGAITRVANAVDRSLEGERQWLRKTGKSNMVMLARRTSNVGLQFVAIPNHDTVASLISNFPEDYVQCAIWWDAKTHTVMWGRTGIAREAHESLTVQWIASQPRISRLNKISYKGFHLPHHINRVACRWIYRAPPRELGLQRHDPLTARSPPIALEHRGYPKGFQCISLSSLDDWDELEGDGDVDTDYVGKDFASDLIRLKSDDEAALDQLIDAEERYPSVLLRIKINAYRAVLHRGDKSNAVMTVVADMLKADPDDFALRHACGQLVLHPPTFATCTEALAWVREVAQVYCHPFYFRIGD